MSNPLRPREATVTDVARRAGVGKATAARALGGYGAVSEDARERVLAAAEELGYRPNELARTMSTGRSRTVGVVVGDIENPYFALATRGITDAVSQAGYDVVLVNTSEDTGAEREAVRVLLDKRVDGLIVAPADSVDTAHLRDVRTAGRPLVLLDRELDDVDAPAFVVDLAGSTRAATELLLDHGHRRITYVTALDEPAERWTPGTTVTNSAVEARIRGILGALYDRGVEPDHRTVRFGARRDQDVPALTRELLAAPGAPTAVIASDARVGLAMLRTLRRDGLQIPHDLSFVMIDDPGWGAIVDPPLTVIRQPVYEVGHAAGSRLVDLLAGRHGSTPPALSAELVVRESVAPPAATSPPRA